MTSLAPHRDAEDSPGAARSTRPLSIQREERRFLIASGQAQRQALSDRGIPFLRDYRVQSLYMEPGNVRTWSVGKSQVKFRLRQYNGTGPWWFEIKTNTSGAVDKTRRQVTAAQIDRLGMRPMVLVRYSREEFENSKPQDEGGDTLAGWLRLTIDTDVTAFQVPRDVPPSEAMQEEGRALATLKNRVLEVKSGQEEVPLWLPHPAEWPGSKSRFAIAALYGQSNMWAPAYTPFNPAREQSA